MIPWRWACTEFDTKSNYVNDSLPFIGYANNAKLAELEACYRAKNQP